MNSKRLLLVMSFVLALAPCVAAQERVKFPAGASSKVLGYAPLWVAAGRGFLEREGLDAEVTAIRDGANHAGAGF